METNQIQTTRDVRAGQTGQILASPAKDQQIDICDLCAEPLGDDPCGDGHIDTCGRCGDEHCTNIECDYVPAWLGGAQ